jgi:c-di-GMP-binding flagellar brake protein YcgR
VKPYIDNDEDHFEIGFEQFKLRPGLELEVRTDSGKLLEHRAQFVMAFASRGVLISLRVNDPEHIEMKPDETYQVSGFNGRFDFSFKSKALKVDTTQFTVLLEVPLTVSIHFVRKYQRAELTMPAAVSLPGGKDTKPVTIRNLSLGGAGIDCVSPLGAPGDTVTLLLQVTFDNKREVLQLNAVIRRVTDSSESLMSRTGVEFVEASREDKLLLHYYISTATSEFNII